MQSARTVQHYIDGAKAGSGEVMRPAFHEHAMCFGYLGSDLIADSIEQIFKAIEQMRPATGLKGGITGIDLVDTVATVRLKFDDWTGKRFTDVYTLLKVDGEWFATINQARTVIGKWLRQYNHIRPHQAFNMRPPLPETLSRIST